MHQKDYVGAEQTDSGNTSEEDYEILGSGRVKAAGVPLDVLFDPGLHFSETGTPEAAREMGSMFLGLRHSPPDELRDRIFPRSRGTKDQFRNGALLSRPVLKTDQGAGQFLSFEAGQENGTGPFMIAGSSGFCIEEEFFSVQLEHHNYPVTVMQELASVKAAFGREDLAEAQLAYERLQIAAEACGIYTSREAQVGREALFFIRPSTPAESIRVSESMLSEATRVIREQAGIFSQYAKEARDKFCSKYGISGQHAPYYQPLYFQADVQLMQNGEAVLDQIQLPDVGLFLTTLDPQENTALTQIQQVMMPLAQSVIDRVAETVRLANQQTLYLVTRDAVLQQHEDILERREIFAFTQRLAEYGITVRPLSVSQATALKTTDVALVLNVDTDTSAYVELLKRHVSGEGAKMYPDPFLLLSLAEMTGCKRAVLSTKQLEGLTAIVKGVDLRGSAEDIFRATVAQDAYLRTVGITDDVFHIYASSQKTPVACYRYDVRGMQIALSYLKAGDSVVARNIPINPHNAVLFRANRPIYSVFRFMAVAKGEL